jgi:hypothetical protein
VTRRQVPNGGQTIEGPGKDTSQPGTAAQLTNHLLRLGGVMAIQTHGGAHSHADALPDLIIYCGRGSIALGHRQQWAEAHQIAAQVWVVRDALVDRADAGTNIIHAGQQPVFS